MDPDESKSAFLHMRINPALKAAAEELARSREQSLAQLVEAAIQDAIARAKRR